MSGESLKNEGTIIKPLPVLRNIRHVTHATDDNKGSQHLTDLFVIVIGILI